MARFVYILRSLGESEHFYVGMSEDVFARLEAHNAGRVAHTSKYKPWGLKTYLWFDDDAKAAAFEAYLKSASGRAFAKKRL